MRALLLLFATAMVINACNGQSGAVKDQQSAYKVLDDMKKKGLQPAADNGWTMTCLIDGKPWKAAGLYPPAMVGRILGENGTSHISFYDKERYEVGQKMDCARYAVEFNPPGTSNDLWTGHAGEVEITKITNGWVEGKFFFTATAYGDPGKKIQVTNGFFRFAPSKR